MERQIFEPTAEQITSWEKKCSRNAPGLMPSDDEFRARGKKGRKPWGLLKRDWILNEMKFHPEYLRGVWQGRVDAARGLGYSEERNENTYNLGYYRGYTDYESNRRGWDENTRRDFDARFLAE